MRGRGRFRDPVSEASTGAWYRSVRKSCRADAVQYWGMYKKNGSWKPCDTGRYGTRFYGCRLRRAWMDDDLPDMIERVSGWPYG